MEIRENTNESGFTINRGGKLPLERNISTSGKGSLPSLMALLKVICWALIFIIRIRLPPGKSLAI